MKLLSKTLKLMNLKKNPLNCKIFRMKTPPRTSLCQDKIVTENNYKNWIFLFRNDWMTWNSKPKAFKVQPTEVFRILILLANLFTLQSTRAPIKVLVIYSKRPLNLSMNPRFFKAEKFQMKRINRDLWEIKLIKNT